MLKIKTKIYYSKHTRKIEFLCIVAFCRCDCYVKEGSARLGDASQRLFLTLESQVPPGPLLGNIE